MYVLLLAFFHIFVDILLHPNLLQNGNLQNDKNQGSKRPPPPKHLSKLSYIDPRSQDLAPLTI